LESDFSFSAEWRKGGQRGGPLVITNVSKSTSKQKRGGVRPGAGGKASFSVQGNKGGGVEGGNRSSPSPGIRAAKKAVGILSILRGERGNRFGKHRSNDL